MNLLNSKARVTLGLVGIMSSLVMLAFFLNIVPERNSAVQEGRAALAEAVAVYSTALVKTAHIATANTQRLEFDFKLLAERNDDLLSLALRHKAERNDDLLSLALRHKGGRVLVSTGDHVDQWQKMEGEFSKDSQIRVPIWAGKQKWGQLELHFTPISVEGFWGVLNTPMVKMVLFMGLASFLIYYFYLGKVLRQLDPSQAIPGRVRSALDTMAEGLLILDRKEQIVLANQAFSAMIDQSTEDLLGFRAGELPWLDSKGNKIEKAKRPWVQSLTQGEINRDSIIRFELPGNEFRTFKTNSSPVLGDGGKHAGVLVSFSDITELEKKESELRKSKMEAEEANHAKSSFLANMSHEIRTPMNAILGFTEILKRGYVKNEEESLKYLNTIHSSGKNLLELINDILDLSKVESGHLEVEKLKVEPYSTIYEVLAMLKVKTDEKDLDLEFRADGALPKEIETDPVRLRQIAFNLIGNSIKFTEAGHVTVTCRFEKKTTGSQLLIDITDSGIGMTEEALKNIFNPFAQADTTVTRRFGGTGLGLTISRRFAQAMGGDITVTSELGKGSTFTVALATGDLEGVPFLQPEDLKKLQQDLVVKEEVRWELPPARVLVVDDGTENRELVKFILEEAGLTVEEAENGQEGVDKALASDFDVVLLDVQMPVMDGFTAAGILREEGFGAPVIALTANAMKGFEEQCLEAGYSGYLSKPINIDLFMKKMAQLLGGRKVEVQLASTSEPDTPQPDKAEQSPAVDSSPIVSRLLLKNNRFRKIVERFVDDLEGQIETMEQVASRDDFKEVANLAHWLRGAGGTVGFSAFTEPATQLEAHAKDKNKPQIMEHIATIRAIAARIVMPDSETVAPAPTETKGAAEISPATSAPAPAAPGAEAGQKPVVSRLADNKRLRRIILNFVKKLEEEVIKMEEAVKIADMQELSGLAHWLKGAAGTMGYDDFTKPATELENFAKANQAEQAAKVFETVKALASAVVPPSDEDDHREKTAAVETG